MALGLVTAGESHGPALAAIVTGLPAGLRLDRDGDRRRPATPPAGIRAQPSAEARVRRGGGALRPPARRHARDAADARRSQPRSRELDVGDEPVAPRGRAVGEGNEARDAAAARARRPRRRSQVRPRRRPERARASLRTTYGGARRRRRGREGSARGARDRRRGAAGRGRRRDHRRGHARRDRRRTHGPRHARRRRRGRRDGCAARSRLVRREGAIGSTHGSRSR